MEKRESCLCGREIGLLAFFITFIFIVTVTTFGVLLKEVMSMVIR